MTSYQGIFGRSDVGSHWTYALGKRQPQPWHTTRRAFFVSPGVPPFFSGLDHDSFMKTQREMGLLRVLLGKSYFVFMTTFLSSAAERP